MAIFSSVTKATSETVPFLLCDRGSGAELGQGWGYQKLAGFIGCRADVWYTKEELNKLRLYFKCLLCVCVCMCVCECVCLSLSFCLPLSLFLSLCITFVYHELMYIHNSYDTQICT